MGHKPLLFSYFRWSSDKLKIQSTPKMWSVDHASQQETSGLSTPSREWVLTPSGVQLSQGLVHM